MSGGGSQFSISEIAIGTFGEAAVTERGEGEFIAKPSCHYNLLYDTPQIAQILAISDPGERCRGIFDADGRAEKPVPKAWFA